MARKESVTIDDILETAFMMAKEEGFENVTARKVANQAGCSTQPIFRVFKNMDDLCDAVFEKAVEYFNDYYTLYPKTGKAPFVNLGMAYIAFAKDERNLFKLLFINENRRGKSLYELLNGKAQNVVYEINLARVQGVKDPGSLFMKMWMCIHGAACMSLTGDYDLTDLETCEMLENAYKVFSV
ncbi:MAG: TetR/AcrR family transcriptional regulator [Lachnospiraceae bacterium]|nr:TetR/AcrR family transcriptional regulator [Lachnospiraceae bacterium]